MSKETVRAFWQAMATNDFHRAAEWLHDEFVLEWPQSGERITGPKMFAAMNTAYPSHGAWQFTIHQLLEEGDVVVSDVSVTDGVQKGRAITFSTIENGKIRYQREFWPDPFPAPAWRKPFGSPMPRTSAGD